MSTPITFTGNLTNDPELKFTGQGQALVNFTVAVNERKLNKETNQWEDGDSTFFNCSAFRQLAENVADSLGRGMRVIVSGKIKQRSYEKDGQKFTVFQVEVDEVGPSLKYASAKVTKLERNQRQANVSNSRNDDPWVAPNNDPWTAPVQDDIPPF